MNKLEKEFYNEIYKDIKDFSGYVIERLEGSKNIEFSEVKEEYERLKKLDFNTQNLSDIKKVIQDAMIGVIHSMFVSIDGGTALSSEGKALELIDLKTNKSLTEGALHENFMEVIEE